jgi:hypothetical protein
LLEPVEGAEVVAGGFKTSGYRVIEQRLPRRAYVVMLDEQ